MRVAFPLIALQAQAVRRARRVRAPGRDRGAHARHPRRPGRDAPGRRTRGSSPTRSPARGWRCSRASATSSGSRSRSAAPRSSASTPGRPRPPGDQVRGGVVGRRARIAGPGGHRIFLRVDGPAGAPWLTFLHGFPTSSLDWARHVRPPRRRAAPARARLPRLRRLRQAARRTATRCSSRPTRSRRRGATSASSARRSSATTTATRSGRSCSPAATTATCPVELTSAAFLNGGMIPALHRAAAGPEAAGPQLRRPVADTPDQRAHVPRRACGASSRARSPTRSCTSTGSRSRTAGGATSPTRCSAYIAERRRYADAVGAGDRARRRPAALRLGPARPGQRRAHARRAAAAPARRRRSPSSPASATTPSSRSRGRWHQSCFSSPPSSAGSRRPS